MSKSDLKIDWATYRAAKYACENWHYSGTLPAGKLVKVGIWEYKKFVGVVIFSRGASRDLLTPYGLKQDQGCELARVALTGHINPVSRIVSIAMKFLQRQSPGMRIVVSYADVNQGHHGGIYQAGGWVYSGTTNPEKNYLISGKEMHPRSVCSKYGTRSLARLASLGVNAETIKTPGKHRYLMPLDKEMREHVIPLAKPYPKRVKQATSGDHPESGGAAPTHTLQIKEAT